MGDHGLELFSRDAEVASATEVRPLFAFAAKGDEHGARNQRALFER
jgi:hypothetical protein